MEIDLKKYKVVCKGKIEWLALKKHSGIFNCDIKITSPDGFFIVLRVKDMTRDTITFDILDA